MNFARWVIGIASLFMLLLVGVGFALPDEWSVTREIQTTAAPHEVWPLVSDLQRWDDWAPLGQVESEFSARTDGVGARRSWSSEDWGTGEVRIVAATEPTTLDYRVAVQDSSIITAGAMRLEPSDGGTRIVWTETGDFGWNPFLAYIALGMERTQGAVLEQSLRALAEAAEGGVAEPADSIPPDAPRPTDSEAGGAQGDY